MFRAIIFEIFELFVTVEKSKKERLILRFVDSFIIIALLLLIFADYIYLCNKFNLMAYVGVLLTCGIGFLLFAIITRLVFLWMARRIINKKLASLNTLVNFVTEVLPVIKLVPTVIAAYMFFTKTETKKDRATEEKD